MPISDVFVAATLAAPRKADGCERMPTALDCRSALSRIAAGMSVATGLSIETGWTLVRRKERESDLATKSRLHFSAVYASKSAMSFSLQSATSCALRSRRFEDI